MGATVLAYWPEITEDQNRRQPGFPSNDCAAWANWVVEMQDEADQALLIKAGVGALLTFTTAGIEDDEVDWVTPDALAAAALKLCDLLAQGHPAVQRAFEVYEPEASNVETAQEEFITDLQELATLARWAKEQGASRMTLAVNW